jgi:oxygen-dependent protoporphyrinogen oxidase
MSENDAALPETDVAVVGAGITGLTAAHFLTGHGLQVRVIEAQGRAGGAIRTTRHGEFQVEHGPNSLLDTYPLLHRLCEDLGIAGELVYASDEARNRYIVRDGRLHPLPMSPPALIRSGLFSTGAKFRLLVEPFVGRAPAGVEETLAQFVERRLGREFLEYAIDAFVAGVYAGVPERLSVRDAFPKLYALEEKYGSVLKGAILGRRERRKSGRTAKQSARMFSFREGMQTLIDALARERDGALHLNTRLIAVRQTDRGYALDLVSAGRAWQLNARAALLTIPVYAYEGLELDLEFDDARQALSQIYYPPVAVVFFGYRENPGSRPLDGFGFLIPSRERRQTLGTLWSSSLFPGRAPERGVALTTFIGGVRQPENAFWEEGKLVEAVHSELRDLLGIHARPDEVVVERWEKAIPQYQPGHRQLIAALERCEARHSGLHVAGSFRGGISVGDCIEQSEKLAGRIATGLGEP